jgi:protein-disulfide isomerase
MIHGTSSQGPAASLDPLEEGVDHIRGPAQGPVILEYGDYECPYSRQAYREIQRLQKRLDDGFRFAFRHFPLTEVHPHALAAAAAAEAAGIQGKFWEMHESLFRHQSALAEVDLRHYAAELGLGLMRFDEDRNHAEVLRRVGRDVQSGLGSGQVHGTPTLFIDGVVHGGSHDPGALLEALRR